jgi:hypothetical protein
LRVDELIDVLRRYPQALEVELAVVAPPDEEGDIEIDRYSVEGVLEWEDEDGVPWLWLVGGEQGDVDVFLDDVEEHDHR